MQTDFTCFINSSSIKRYYRDHPELELEKESPWVLFRLIVESSYASHREKVNALHALKERENCAGIIQRTGEETTFTDMINGYISHVDEVQRKFEQEEKEAYYQAFGDSEIGIHYGNCDSYKKWVDGVDSIYKEAERYIDRGELIRVWIDKYWIGRHAERVSAMYRLPDMELIKLRSSSDHMYKDVIMTHPLMLRTPFERGDLLRYKDPDDSRNDKIFVLDHFVEQKLDNGDVEELNSGSWKPYVYGYFIDDENDIVYDSLWDNTNENLEYCDISGLWGYKKYLEVISHIIKGESSESDIIKVAKDFTYDEQSKLAMNMKTLKYETDQSLNPRYNVYLNSSYALFKKMV